jgi:hypothetical protein
MFNEFSITYKCDKVPQVGLSPEPADLIKGIKGLNEFLVKYSGCSFNEGLYRIHQIEQIRSWNQIVDKAFPDLNSQFFCFAFDWLGRQFAIDLRTKTDSKILLLEPGTGESLEIPKSFTDFHNIELIENPQAALALDFYKKWFQKCGKPLSHDKCVGYKKPLYLGGIDDLDNLEITDMEVYWDINSQLLNQVRNLPPGTKINKINLS